MSTKQPFTIHITDEVLDDLRERLTRTRWAEDFANDEWAYGTNGAYLRELVDVLDPNTTTGARTKPR